MAGLFAVASSKSRNFPMACGRMASRSYEVISQRSAPLAAKTLTVVVPEFHHFLVELALAVNRARHFCHGSSATIRCGV